MRILLAIPHFFDTAVRGDHGSERGRAETRAETVRLCIASLTQHFSQAQSLINSHWQCFHPANGGVAPQVTIVLCTTGERHLLTRLRDLDVEHVATTARSFHLGFECHKVLRDRLGDYDYFGYLEDDLRISDSLFFTKLRWFNDTFGNDAVLQPNRFELSLRPAPHKLYCDGNVSDVDQVAGLQPEDGAARLEAESFGLKFAFQRVSNPHSGCFFVSAAQLARWAAQPDFAVPSDAFCGPLESAATLGIMRHFRVYKPARENAGFLEIEHIEPRLLGHEYFSVAGEPGSLRSA